ncbi:hypothetical protein DFH29DRAFT_805341 [Suillus ampliporus]|nr:hypothetical protein DFH29DRAFT_805341 [Suillus ampliporus]
MVIPGPNEPTLEQLNNIMEKFVSEMTRLYGGTEKVLAQRRLEMLLSEMDNPNEEQLDHAKLLGSVTYPRFHKTIRLQTVDMALYGLVLQHLQEEWQELGILIHADVVLADRGACFMGHVTSFSHVFVETLRYGAATQPRRRSARYAYINGRIAVEIEWIFKVDIEYEQQDQLSKTVAIVCRFTTNDEVPQFPWDMWAVDLGVQVWHANMLGEMEVVDVRLISGQLILIPITVSNLEYWVTVAHNHVSL